MELGRKYEELKKYLSSFENIAVAFSGGIDSAFLLKAAVDVFGDNIIAITANPFSFPKRELEASRSYCERVGVRHIVFDVDELNIDGFAMNTKDRCYICKKVLFEKMFEIIRNNDISIIAEGSNIDDNKDYRPGLKAVEELGVLSPLRKIGYTKNEIRKTAEKLGISIWNKQSSACLSSRFAYGEIITGEKLIMVENAEQILYDMGFQQFRVRIHGLIARIEVMPEEFEKLIENRIEIYNTIKDYGFTYVTMDLKGYRTGSMNENL